MNRITFTLTIFLILKVCIIQAQNESVLKYKDGYFYKINEYSESWKTADHVFEGSKILKDRYNKFRRSKKASRILGNAALAQVLLGFVLWRSIDCQGNCIEQIIPAFMVFLTAPATGIAALTFKLFSIRRNNKLLNTYNHDLTNISNYESNQTRIDICISPNGLKINFSF